MPCMVCMFDCMCVCVCAMYTQFMLLLMGFVFFFASFLIHKCWAATTATATGEKMERLVRLMFDYWFQTWNWLANETFVTQIIYTVDRFVTISQHTQSDRLTIRKKGRGKRHAKSTAVAAAAVQ